MLGSIVPDDSATQIYILAVGSGRHLYRVGIGRNVAKVESGVHSLVLVDCVVVYFRPMPLISFVIHRNGFEAAKSSAHA